MGRSKDGKDDNIEITEIDDPYKELFDSAEKKYKKALMIELSNANSMEEFSIQMEQEMDLFSIIKNSYLYSLTKKTKDRDTYFKNKKEYLKYNKSYDLLKIFYSKVTILTVGIGLPSIAAAGYAILDKVCQSNKKLSITFLIILLVILLSFLVLWFFTKKWAADLAEKESEFRKQGETWIRHSAFLSDIIEILMHFTGNSGKYNNLSLIEQKDLFTEDIINAMKSNSQKFQENMKGI